LTASFFRFVTSERSSEPEIFLVANDSKNCPRQHLSPKTTLHPTSCSFSCQNSFSLAWSKNGKFRTWLTKMYRSSGNSESCGATSPTSDRNGAPKRCSAVGLASSAISQRVCSEI